MNTISLSNYIGGEHAAFTGAQFTPVYNPSRGELIAQAPDSDANEVERTVRVAKKAFPDWADTPVVERARVMFRFAHLLEEHFDELARLVTREHGKTHEEAKGDIRRGIEMVELACHAPTMLMGQALDQVARGIDGRVERHPLGVCAGITPFNFPAMVPLWMFPIAIVCGNTFILKPSPKVPLTPLRLAELLTEAGLPKGVFNVVLGGNQTVDALLKHPDVAAISFVGSTTVAKYIYETGTAHGKRVQAAGGAKNYMLVMPDADFDAATNQIIGAAFGCSGQRCMAGSIAVAVGKAGDPLLERLNDSVGRMKVGPTDGDSPVDMGPVIDAVARDRIRSYIDLGVKEGAKLATDGRGIHPVDGAEGFFVGPTIFDQVAPQMQIARDEIFGPVLSVMRMEDLSDAIAQANQSQYGNGAVIFTRDGGAARTFARYANCGMIGVNVGVPAPMAIFPFTGWNQSFFGDLHIQGTEGFHFYTHNKVVLSRWPSPEDPGKRVLGW
ncbi:MAG TPA: CoA-acylating methylmalonate-semialdehyde dehydrogenase [Blastocatellia bacterium]|nr:CoA-acylating methylmalonate-semialdehyde dehydrogenase [Blastocatellia bacterium]HMV85505.1 CoA-acylating methylmalonate-semialdehyde dehydrogenase [Blastocatellia bacterium]HMY70317.1 CoA-acylating methylmalonate-semialdehyde dehydrogenase [Blastocatellia bacterium]HMZ19984.1 CoA-acylating methylmalonate-semialdehyde dehydrogenase [Blastocatellia bacterium]HNG32328.1 CoA-acylating methylmalonate-semialdehyde dehydrogenase [Blastocatellia bacterium]